MNRIYFIGDLSQSDARILIDNCKDVKRILEFGVGGSTQIMSQYSPTYCDIICVDTAKEWIKKTSDRLELLKNNGYTLNCRPKFVIYEEWESKVSGQYDLIFNDGVMCNREDFAMKSWKYLKVGGKLIFHDTKIDSERDVVLKVVKRYWLEILSVVTNPANSNMTIITKKVKQPYYNWNDKEKKDKWETGRAIPPKGLWKDK